MPSPEQSEAIKLTSDWSKWLVAVQTGAVGFVASQLKRDPSAPPVPPEAKHAFLGAAACLILGIIAAGALQSALPHAATDLQPGKKLWDRGIYFINRELGRVWIAAELHFVFFAIGMALLSLAEYLFIR